MPAYERADGQSDDVSDGQIPDRHSAAGVADTLQQRPLAPIRLSRIANLT